MTVDKAALRELLQSLPAGEERSNALYDLNSLLAENEAIRGERAVLADILRDALGPLRVDLMNVEADGDCEDSQGLRAIIDRAEAVLYPPAPPQGDGA